MKHGVALMFLSQVRGSVWPLNIEITDPQNLLDLTNTVYLEFPDLDLHTVVGDHLLFRKSVPNEWSALRETDFEAPLSTSSVWSPNVPTPTVTPEVTFYNFGKYNRDGYTFQLVGFETLNLDITLKNRKTVLGRPVPPQMAFETEPDNIQDLLATAWRNNGF